MNRNRLSAILSTLCCLAALTLPQTVSRASVQKSERMTVTGTIVGVGGRFGGRSLPFTLTVDRFTSDSDMQALNTALQSGQDELLKTLSGQHAGRIAIGNNAGITANAIINTSQGEGGSKLTVIFERNIQFFELRRGTRSADYRFGYMEIYLDRNGRNGQGMFIPAARIRLRDGDTWEVEDFGEFPARLMGVRAHGSVNVAR
jgi:hypothetical protein